MTLRRGTERRVTPPVDAEVSDSGPIGTMTAAPDERSTPLMSTTHADYRLSQLDELEAESIHIFREVAAEFEKPVLMFSGGKDSICLLYTSPSPRD